ncbi:MAG: DUF721 domain-containing protein [Pseudomonadota bacterium]|nr:DUF721 domain-containing protein [Pseudomonadota bacterium]
MDGPNPVNNLLARGGLAVLTRRAREHAELSRLIAERLPESLRDRLTPGGLAGGRLTLLAESSVWATKARFMAAEIQSALADLPEPIEEIKIRVAQTAPRIAQPSGTEPRRIQPLTEPVRKLLLETGETLPEGPIRSALLRLGRPDEDHR